VKSGHNEDTRHDEQKGYPKDRLIAFILAILVAVPLFALVIDEMAIGDNSSLYMELIDENGEAISSPLFKDSIDFDTITTETGTEFILQTGLEIHCIPSYLIIHSQKGTFNVSVRMIGLAGTWMDNYGIRISVNDYSAELKSSNGYSSTFQDNGSPATILPETKYKISLESMDGKSTTIPPESIKDITVLFTFEGADKTHLVAFVDGDEVVCVKALVEGEPCGDLPTLTKEDMKFDGWYDANGKKVTSDTIFTFEEDTVFKAKWGPSTTWIIWWLILILLALSIYIIWSYRRDEKRRFE
jgi:hypothetical protein